MTNYRRDVFRLLEAALVGLFFVQAVRFLYGTLYAHLSSASLVGLTADRATLSNQPGVINLIDVQVELLVVGVALLAPLLSILFGRLWFGPPVAAIACAAGRVFMTAYGGTPLGVMGGAIAAGAGGLYLTVSAVRRSGIMPVCLIFGFAFDQLVRLYGATIDITWSASFLEIQTVLSVGLFVIAVLATIFERLDDAPPGKGEITGWGALALGGLLYLQFAVLGLPNMLAHHVGLDYIAVAPWLVAATLLPLVAEVRNVFRNFLSMFDGRYRGWVWFLTIALWLVVGFRFDGLLGAAMLILAQFMLSLSFWWVVQPSDGRRNFTGIAVIVAVLFFLALTGADFLTYEYAFVRGVDEPFGTLLRAFRGLGLAVSLFAALLACLPAILARKRIPWRGGHSQESLAAVALVVMGGVLAASLAAPVVAEPPQGGNILRVSTLNLHGGYSLYFGTSLADLANQIAASGTDVLLLQEVETGRLVSFGVDQSAWLARRLKMQVSYFPTNESFQGLAILSKLPIAQSQGALLSSQSKQTGVLFARLRALNGDALDVYNTQLTFLFQGGYLTLQQLEEDQTKQIQEILNFVEQNESANSHLLIGGTFNHAPKTNIYLYLAQRGFVDPFAEQPEDRVRTLRLINRGPERVDYLWLRRISATNAGVTPILYSNHDMPTIQIDPEVWER